MADMQTMHILQLTTYNRYDCWMRPNDTVARLSLEIWQFIRPSSPDKTIPAIEGAVLACMSVPQHV